VIYHNFYGGEKLTRSQIVWIHLDCPKNGSLTTLVYTLMRLTDKLIKSDYYRTIGKSGAAKDTDLTASFLEWLPELGLGLLAIDELQYLQAIVSSIRKIRQQLPQSRTKMTENLLHTLVTLDNNFGIPELFIGTPPAKQVISTRFHVLARSERLGNPDWYPLKENSEDWKDFVEALCDIPLLKHKTDPVKISPTLHFNSFGIPGVAMIVFRAAHEYLFDQGQEKLLPVTFDKAMKSFPEIGKAIRNLQSIKELSVLELMDDVMSLTDNNDDRPVNFPKTGSEQESNTQMGINGSSSEDDPKEGKPPRKSKKNKPIDLSNDLKDADEF
jgi:hypothetical protein